MFKCLLKIHKSFNGQYENELTVEPGQIAQFVRKIDKFWYEIYFEDIGGKIPIDCCYELKDNLIKENLRIIKEKNQIIFISKHDFLNNCEDGDLKFSRNEIIIGFHSINDDWWNGTRLNSVKHFNNYLVVDEADCGIFPLTYVWKLRNDLLPDFVFDNQGIRIKNVDKDNYTNTLQNSVTENTTDNQQSVLNNKKYLFYVKVIKTMEAQLDQEIDLPELDERLGIIKECDKLYYEAESLTRKIRGIIPKNFVTKMSDNFVDNNKYNNDTLDNPNDNSSSNEQSPIPPSFSPPPPPDDIMDIINFKGEKFLPQPEFNNNDNQNLPQEDLPPSYEAAMLASSQSQPVAYGYANYMFNNEMEPYGRALYDFDAQDDSELSLRRDQIVRLIRYYDQDWMEGEINGRIGFFPRNYISIIVDCKDSQPKIDSKQIDLNENQVEAIEFPPNTLAKVIYDFNGEMEQDLKVHIGDIITLLRRFTTTDWIEAKDSSGNIGFVHMNLCEPIENNYIITTTSTTTNIYPQLDVTNEKELLEEQSKTSSKTENEQNVIQTRPHRRAPVVPHNTTNVFPTFNQFLLQEKQEHYQFDIDGNELSLQSQSNNNNNDKFQKNHKQNQRECIITELMQTEKDYCHALNVCYRVFNSSEYEAKKINVDVDKLITNMKSIINVSKNLIKSLENYAINRSFIDQRVGICFLDLKFQINDSYTQYCRNHDSIHSLLKFYEENTISQSYIKNCLGRIQDQTNCFDLSSIWIKPVQRILKYPLLLNELIKYTEEDHVDYEPLKMAFQMITDIATCINEHKRRQDLIQKYCRKKDPSLTEKLKNLSIHSVMKKSTRLKYRILSSLSFSNTKDKDYDHVLHSFNEMEKIIRLFLKDLKEFMEAFDKLNLEIMSTMETFSDYCNFKQHPRFNIETIREKYLQMYIDQYKLFNKSIDDNVIKSLKLLLDKFISPLRLINKRNDKRLDYEASFKSSSSSNNTENVNLLKNTFEAINKQLLDELPILTDSSFKIFINCVNIFFYEYKRFIGLIAKNQLDLYELPLVKNMKFEFFSDIEEIFHIKNNLNYQQMLKEFSLLHSNIFNDISTTTFTTTSTTTTSSTTIISSSSSSSSFPRFGSKRNTNTWKNAIPINKIDEIQSKKLLTSKSNLQPQQQQESHRQILKNKYDKQHLYTVIKDYESCDILEINLRKDDLIAVIKYKEPNGNDNRWYIDRGFIQGFVPKNLLTPYHNQWEDEGDSNNVVDYRYDQVAADDIDNNDHHLSSICSIEPIEPQRYYSLVSDDEKINDKLSNKKNIELTEFDPLLSTTTKSTFQNIEQMENKNEQNKDNNDDNDDDDDDNNYMAAYPFKASGPNQLSMNYGQKVFVLCKHDTSGNKDWWLISYSNQKGYVPGNYLKKN